VAIKIAAPEGRLLRLLQDYQRSQNFLGLRDKTRSDYVAYIKSINSATCHLHRDPELAWAGNP
jgi:hypothetical protein